MLANNKIPIVVLFGPPACGKTMTLARLCHYLSTIGYNIRICEEFRNDMHYIERCKAFQWALNSQQVVEGSYGDILVEITHPIDQSKCYYIYDAPGVWYINEPLPPVLLPVFNSPNPKKWCFFTEPNYADAHGRNVYVQSVGDTYKHFVRPNIDKSIIIYNKIDATPFMPSPQEVDTKAARRDIEYKYPSLFNLFKNQSIITKWFRPYNVMFVPFQTGQYVRSYDEVGIEMTSYTEGPGIFPANLWKVIANKA